MTPTEPAAPEWAGPWICPVCGATLRADAAGTLRCAARHSFDRAKEGYWHLLPVQEMRSKTPGDSREMVAARRAFLAAGWYGVFSAALGKLTAQYGAPAGPGQPLHVLDRRRGKPFDKCNAIWCLDEFTVLNGATRVLPGSHLDDREALRRMRDPMASHPDEVVVEAPKGSVVFHNSHLIHSGRPNASDGDRRSVHAAYTHPAVPTHYDWSELPESIVHRLSPRMLALLDLLD